MQSIVWLISSFANQKVKSSGKKLQRTARVWKGKNNKMDKDKKCAERSISEIQLLEVCETFHTNNRSILQCAPRCSWKLHFQCAQIGCTTWTQWDSFQPYPVLFRACAWVLPWHVTTCTPHFVYARLSQGPQNFNADSRTVGCGRALQGLHGFVSHKFKAYFRPIFFFEGEAWAG